jgi:hypothetical protein
MRIFLYASMSNESVRQDAEILSVRGFDVLTVADVLEALSDPSPQELMHTVNRCVIGSGQDSHRAIVIHPNTDPGAVMDLVGFGRVVDVMVLRLNDLPAIAPVCEAVLMNEDMRVGRFLLPTLEIQKARTLGDRLRAAYRTLLRWEARANAWFGDGLKNPVVSELRKRPVTYRLNTSASTTG